MNKSIALIMMAIAPLANAVQWINAGETNNADQKVFVDASSIRLVNGFKRVWLMDSYSRPQVLGNGPTQYKSALAFYEADCKEGRLRILSALMKSEEMGLGSVLFSFSESEFKWEYPAPGSLGGFKYNLICSLDKSK